MNHHMSNEGFDPYEDDINRLAGIPSKNKDPYGSDYDVARYARHEAKIKGPEGFEGNTIKLAHDALYALQRSKLTAPAGYSDPLAPKRDRENLRKAQ